MTNEKKKLNKGQLEEMKRFCFSDL